MKHGSEAIVLNDLKSVARACVRPTKSAKVTR